MLIDFSVTNYKSIKDEALLSLVADRAQEHEKTHLITPKLSGESRAISLLRSAVIYGPNAAGKTNLIRAFKLMRDFVAKSSTELDGLKTTPFRFDPACRTKPTTFRVTFIVEDVRYEYGFSATPDQVVDEWLYAWPRGRLQTWFERNKVGCKFGNKMSGDKKVWERATRSNALLLSTAVSLNSTQLKPIFNWFENTLHVSKSGTWDSDFSIKCCNKDLKAGILNFLKSADFGISDIRVTEEEFKRDLLPSDMPKEIKNVLEKKLAGQKMTELWFVHHIEGEKPIELEFLEESDGSKKVFELAGPWLDTLANGLIVVVDELHEKLHPTLIRFLVDLFHNPKMNKHGAQLIFSTHDTSILSQEVFRRDQVWFCERNKCQETRLYPLTDFRPRKGIENLEPSYLSGRYGALPYIYPMDTIAGT